MANEQAWALGAEMPLGWERRERKQALEDEERRARVVDLYDKRNRLSSLIPSLTEGSAEHRKATDALTGIESELHAAYHPAVAPGALQKDWEFLNGLVWRKRSATPAVLAKTTEQGTPETTFTMNGQTVK